MAASMSLNTDVIVPSGGALIFEATPQVSQGKSFMPRSAYRLVAVLDDATVYPHSVLSAYTGLFGILQAGLKTFWRVSVINAEGLASELYSGSVIAS